MTFRPRNAYYLRISTNVVLPLFVSQIFRLSRTSVPDKCIDQLYLDERHIDWMSDVVLQHVLADLRPLCVDIDYCNAIIDQLPAESSRSFRQRRMFTLAQEPRLLVRNEELSRSTVEVCIYLVSLVACSLMDWITETYQFAYFFRKTEPHTVLFKVGKCVDPTVSET